MNCLVSGGSGLIGLNVYKKFKLCGYEVSILHQREIPKIIRRKFLYSENDRIIGVENINKKFDLIVNCSGSSQPKFFTTNPSNVLDANIFGLEKLIKALSSHGTFVQMSSSEIYYGCNNIPCTEEHLGKIEMANPRFLYSASKYISEKILESLLSQDQRGLILRVSSVFGPGVFLDDKRFLYEMIIKGISTRKLVIEHSLEVMRTFLYVDDFIEIMTLLLDNLNGNRIEIWNTGSIFPIKLDKVVNTIAEVLGIPVINKQGNSNIPSLISAQSNSVVSMEKFERRFGKFDYTDFSFGLEKTIQYCNDIYQE